ncbi:unnamed protein product [Closterium sp. Naga37s-1]|nr:unnamed protein product [Closterium sp. Naga37s-1]
MFGSQTPLCIFDSKVPLFAPQTPLCICSQTPHHFSFSPFLLYDPPLPASKLLSHFLPPPLRQVVTEDNGTVFGGFSSQALVASNRRKYQGSSDVFVFTTTAGEPTVYKVTAANRYFILCLNEALSFGGGGHFALCLQEDLLTGSSGACETFCSPCLSKSEDFKIKHVEVRQGEHVELRSAREGEHVEVRVGEHVEVRVRR